MFGIPERRTNQDGVYFYVPLLTPVSIEKQLEFQSKGAPTPDPSLNEILSEVQDRILSELPKNKQLFKNPPSIESLQAITPNWGCIYVGGQFKWNKTMVFEFPDLAAETFPAQGELALAGLTITRSTISPVFHIKNLRKSVETQIDFEWPAAAATHPVIRNELEEVSDIASAAEGSVVLRNPAEIRKEKLAAKEKVRNAFLNAEKARLEAEELARVFYASYDVSDDESTFSEWIDSDDESTD